MSKVFEKVAPYDYFNKYCKNNNKIDFIIDIPYMKPFIHKNIKCDTFFKMDRGGSKGFELTLDNGQKIVITYLIQTVNGYDNSKYIEGRRNVFLIEGPDLCVFPGGCTGYWRLYAEPYRYIGEINVNLDNELPTLIFREITENDLRCDRDTGSYVI